MANRFLQLSDRQSWEKLLAESAQHPVLVFKHSNSCPISSWAYREMEKFENVNLLIVQSARELSHEVATITGVQHETPQIIVLKDGKAVWNASHYNVKAASISEVLEAHS